MSEGSTHNVYGFLHVPKTAGTSFEDGLKSRFGDARLYRDYGLTPRTSDFIRTFVFKGRPAKRGARAPRTRAVSKARVELLRHLVSEAAGDSQPTFLCGHLMYRVYPFRELGVPVITFLRDPVDRILSYYTHRRRYDDEPRPLDQFVREDHQAANFQSWMLDGIDIEDVAFLGVTERYRESVELFNRQTGFDVPVLERNRLSDRPAEVQRLDPKIRELILSLNERDVELYGAARKLVDERLAEAGIGSDADLAPAPR